jgi:ATP synthase protein I
MLASYAVVLRRSVMLTVPVAVVMVVLSAVFGGAKGLLGAVLAAGLVAAFFAVSVIAVTLAARHSPRAMMVTAMITYLLKIIALLFVVSRYSGTTAFNGKLFGLTAIACVLAWTLSQAMVSMRLKVPYVEPDGER